MGRIKSENFSDSQNRFADFNRNLSSPARIAIMEFLLTRRTSTGSDVVHAVQLGEGAVRQHLKALIRSGFVEIYIGASVPLYKANHAVFLQWEKMLRHMSSNYFALAEGEPWKRMSKEEIDAEEFNAQIKQLMRSK